MEKINRREKDYSLTKKKNTRATTTRMNEKNYLMMKENRESDITGNQERDHLLHVICNDQIVY